MHTSEMRAWESAIERTLESGFYKADQTEVENFLNSVRTFLVRKVKILPEKIDDDVVEFPPMIAEPPTKINSANVRR